MQISLIFLLYIYIYFFFFLSKISRLLSVVILCLGSFIIISVVSFNHYDREHLAENKSFKVISFK